MKLVFVVFFAATNAVWSFYLHTEDTRLEGRIVGGETAIKGQFPYMALIETHYQRSYKFCGGAFIGVRWVLSAASCFFNMKYANVFLGINDFEEADISYTVKSKAVIPHPEWSPESNNDDIAMVYIPHTAICLTVFPVPLPLVSVFPQISHAGFFAFATGWGAPESNQIMATLQYKRMEVISNEVCALLRSDVSADPNSEKLCTSKPPGTTLTEYDVGAPLVSEDGVLVGLMTKCTPTTCTDSESVVVFNRVLHYLDWIYDVERLRGNYNV